MNNEPFFSNINCFGNLFLSYIFNEYDMEPILFTLKDNSKNLYICLCYEMRDTLEWIISKIDIEDLKNLITLKKSIRNVFLSGKEIKIIKKIEDTYKSYHFLKKENIDLLPGDNVKLRCNFDLATEYLNKLLEQQSLEFSFEAKFLNKDITNIPSVYETIKSIKYLKRSTYEESVAEIKKNSKSIFAA